MGRHFLHCIHPSIIYHMWNNSKNQTPFLVHFVVSRFFCISHSMYLYSVITSLCSTLCSTGSGGVCHRKLSLWSCHRIYNAGLQLISNLNCYLGVWTGIKWPGCIRETWDLIGMSTEEGLRGIDAHVITSWASQRQLRVSNGFKYIHFCQTMESSAVWNYRGATGTGWEQNGVVGNMGEKVNLIPGSVVLFFLFLSFNIRSKHDSTSIVLALRFIHWYLLLRTQN